MTAIIDSGFLYATLDAADKNHARVTEALATLSDDDDLMLPTVVLVEVTYLLQVRVGHFAMRQFISRMSSSPIEFVAVGKADLMRIHDLLETYSDLQLDFVDVAIVTIAERLDIRRVLTVDQRDFRTIRPQHCDYFEILP